LRRPCHILGIKESPCGLGAAQAFDVWNEKGRKEMRGSGTGEYPLTCFPDVPDARIFFAETPDARILVFSACSNLFDCPR
jgi:hypothetical protein